MAEQIYIGNFAKGLTQNRLPFNIDNDAFAYLYNFYVWRGRVKRKRGTIYLGQLTIQVQVVASNPLNWQYTGLALSSGTVNLLTFVSAGSGATIKPGTINITGATDGTTYTDPAKNGVLTATGGSGTGGTINYATGVLSISMGGSEGLTGKFSFYPANPVMGLEDFDYSGGNTEYPVLLAFDTTNAYQIFQVAGGASTFYNVTYYKGTNTPFEWNGTDYDQFWTTNYQNALWATNFNPGLHILKGTYVSGSGTKTITFTFKNGASNFTTLIVGDVLWFNEWGSYVPPVNTTISGATGSPNNATATSVVLTIGSTTNFYVGQQVKITGIVGMTELNGNIYTISSITPSTSITITLPEMTKLTAYDSGGTVTNQAMYDNSLNNLTGTVSDISMSGSGQYVVTFAQNQTVAGTGIVQMLTNSIPGQDGIRWYDGDPTSHTGLPTGTGKGWVNFAPPLTAIAVSINDLTEELYYLVGALAILPFKDRLIFFSPYIQTSSGSPILLQDSVIWSWNGTPYYTLSDINIASVVPTNESASNIAYYVDQPGAGGWRSAGIAQPLITVIPNEDVLLIGFGGDGRKTRFIYTGNDLDPFQFYTINSELPSSATYSAVTMDQGGIDMGQYGFALTTQQSSERIDLVIPDIVFEVQASNNGVQRVNSVRDFYREWIYFSYPILTEKYRDGTICKYPLQTFLLNYRDNTWSILYENFTAHGEFRPQFKKTWATTGFKSWNAWREPWNSGALSPQYPAIVGGNPQGYVLIKGEGTSEAPSGTISAITNSGNLTQITSYNHCVAEKDFLQINGVLGLLSSTITAITPGVTTVITTVNTFTVGQNITIMNVEGMIQLNGNSYLITAASGTSITINVNSSMFGTYTSGGTATYTFNTLIGKVISTLDANTFQLDIPYPTFAASGYLGGGTFTRLSQPLLQTKQFNPYWDQGKKARLAVQRYLMDYTVSSQCTVNLYLSQDPDTVYNDPNQIGSPNQLEYSQVLFTCPESTNLGLTAANTNLQMPTANGQYQIWHRMNTSVIGDSFQIGITLNEAQMKNIVYATDEVTLHGIHLTVEPSSYLS